MSSRCLRTLLLVLPLLAVACGDDSDGGTPPELTPPTVREIQPTGGPIAGNTLLNVYGSGFQDGAKVFLGETELQRTVVVNAFRIYGYTPTATSAQVDVRVVNPDGAYGVLVKGFTYEGPPAPNIDQAEVLNGNTDAVSGGQPVGITVRGAITVAGLTRGVGQAGGVRAEVGFAPGDSELLKMDSYTWEAATYETDSDSGEADVYKGNVLLQPPIGGENREWVVSIRFSIDGGKTWVMADGDGIANGVSAQMMRRVFIARPRVDYCKLGPDGNGANPELFYRPTDTTLIKVAGQVYAAGITQGAGAGSGVVAQLGIGPADSDPRDATGWTWINATYKAEHGNNDEFEADLPNPGTEGKYRVAFRFSISENAWRVCDADGVNDSTEGNLTFSLGKLGTLTVGNEAPKPQVGWCKIGEDQKAPETINYLTTQTSGQKTVYAQVFMTGVTDKVGAGPGLTGQLGWGPANEDPRTSALWNWSTNLAWNKDNFTVNDEWKATLPNPGVNGEYRYAVRFAANGGPVRVCDGNGVDDGGQDFELNQLGTLNVTGEVVVPKVIGYCKLGPDGNAAPETVAYTPSAAGDRKVIAQVWVNGVTSGTGAGAGVVGQLGWGPTGSDPRTAAGWSWTDAPYKSDLSDNDQHEVSLPNPGVTGNYSFVYRFQVNGGAFRYCDSDGVNDSTEGNLTFSLAKMGTLTVSTEPVKLPVTWCKLGEDQKAPETISYLTPQTTDLKTVFAQVNMPGVTDSVGAGAGLSGQLGWGPAGEDPRTSTNWNWSTNLAFNKDQFGVNDEWKATLPNPGVNGEYRYAVRFSANGGPVRVCDGNGVDDGGQEFELNQLGTLHVASEVVVPKVIGYCKLGPDGNSTPETVTYTTTATGDRKVVGQVWVDGVTAGTGAGTGVVAQLGWGPTGEDPTTSANWSWSAAQFKGDIGNNDEYDATLPNPGVAGSYRFAYRFQVNGGALLYCDADGGGSATDFDTAKLGTLTVSAPQPPTTIGYCKLGPDGNTTPETVTYVTTATGDRKVVGQVYVASVTAGTGKGDNVVAQLGWGPAGENPTTSANWSWATSAAYKGDIGDNDEYEATLPNPGAVGSFGFAYRFQVNGGAFLYCDADGNSGASGFDTAKMGTLTVSAPQAPTTVGYCKLGPDGNTTPESVTYITTATADRKVVGQLWVDGVTAGTGAGAGVVGQLGWGPTGEDPTTSANWSWSAAQFKGDIGNNDEYDATLPNPGVVGTYRFAYRFQVNGGAFLYCDADGGSSATDFDATKTGTLVVEAPPAPAAVCRLQSVSGTTVGSGDAVTATGRVRIAGVTDGSGAPAGNLQVQVGVGASDVDASANPAAFTWKVAPYTGEASGEANTDEFGTTVHPAYEGNRAVSLRYTTDGSTWTYCDKDGNDVGGYTMGQQHALTVGKHMDIDYCNLQWPFSIKTSDTGDARIVYGQVYEDGVTNQGGAGTGIVAEFGHGSASNDPGVSGWTWVSAPFLSDEGSNDQFSVNLPDLPVGTSYIYRYSLNGGPYCYGDRNDRGGGGRFGDGFSGGNMGTVVAP
ncbi:IPT/TIG domain-containing protein [Pyxidicoccus sp. MSG2]|uniref:IPT/TIG domain-containing protein n=1 Tax=Pyxidicoccus sp. MSG2 TaxID=2996790 RepID=UPI00226EDA01|nr:IPT/TIG domain-containing protein [Pyxidicoccus sp. MSG2]MCY1021150.1 IPT/TIG domain-containing protein [Pyxidicoccus sp. MSG2]